MDRGRTAGRTRVWLAAVAAGLTLLIVAAPASASVTIGQLATSSTNPCPSATDSFNPGNPPGGSYASPVAGTLTSWSTNNIGPTNPTLTMKVFREVASPLFQVVAHDGPRTLTPTLVSPFGGLSIPVKAGDIIGVDAPSGGAGCEFTAPGVPYFLHASVPDGGEASFFPTNGELMNVQAVIQPNNTFSIASTTLNKKKGTATLGVTVPNPGQLTVAGPAVAASAAAAPAPISVAAAGESQVSVRATGKAKKTLRSTGKVKLKLSLTYTPTGGDPSTQPLALKLKHK